MSFVRIAVTRGQQAERLEALSRAVRDALVAELNVSAHDYFQVIDQHGPGELRFERTFRGGPRSDDWTVVAITSGQTTANRPSDGSTGPWLACLKKPRACDRRTCSS